MQVPMEIAFHNIDKSEWAENVIRDHVARLEGIYGRLTTCRVRVERRANNASHSIPPVVRIEMSIPGTRDLVVAHEPDHLQRKFQTPDLHNAINEAFRIAERRLREIKERRADHNGAAVHEATHEYTGQIAEMEADRDFGFLITKEGGLLYFHRNSVLSGDFDHFERGQDVTYVEAVGDTGPIATKVRVLRAR
jgi:ribosome-associated translation inhibitor RaiA